MLFIATYRGSRTRRSLTYRTRPANGGTKANAPKGTEARGLFPPAERRRAGVMVFEAESGDDVAKLITYWREWAFDVRPALDEMAAWRGQGMKV